MFVYEYQHYNVQFLLNFHYCKLYNVKFLSLKALHFIMGLDGGLITKRPDMIPKSKLKDKIAAQRERQEAYSASYWTNCALSGMTLKAPILISISGAIFNKEEVLRTILEKTIPKKLSYLKHKKYLKEIDLRGASCLIEYVCPLSSKSPTPGTRDSYVLLWKCGHLFFKPSFDALCKDMVCPICGQKNEDCDLVILSGFTNHDFKKPLKKETTEE